MARILPLITANGPLFAAGLKKKISKGTVPNKTSTVPSLLLCFFEKEAQEDSEEITLFFL